MTDMRLVVTGAGGRMGQSLIRLLQASEGVVLVGALERSGSPYLGLDAGRLAGIEAMGIPVTDDALPVLLNADGLLDFSTPAASCDFAALAAQTRIAHVIGTTGFSGAEEARLKAAARHAVVVKSGNMSLGVTLLAALVKQAAKALDPSFDIEIVEMHHSKKVDAPSGTALMLGQAAAAGRDIDLESHADRGRDGLTGARLPGHIGFASLRGGTVVGDHTVIFAGQDERLELVHKAESRAIFARGALRAALWGRRQKPGLYSMADVLGIGDLAGKTV